MTQEPMFMSNEEAVFQLLQEIEGIQRNYAFDEELCDQLENLANKIAVIE